MRDSDEKYISIGFKIPASIFLNVADAAEILNRGIEEFMVDALDAASKSVIDEVNNNADELDHSLGYYGQD